MGKKLMNWYEQPCDIIIPTWNSMPEFKLCLESIFRCIPKKYRGRVIVVDKASEDGTVDYALEQGCCVLTDTGSLGSARLTGLSYADSDWIMFIDSDIEIDEPWFNEMRVLSECLSNTRYDVGWIFGRTIDDVEPLGSEKWYKCRLDFKDLFDYRLINGRAYTHNTICLREPLLDAPIRDVNSWEDSILADCMRDAGYQVVEGFVTCTQHRSDTYRKNGAYTEAWGQVGLLKTHGVSLWSLFRPFWFIWWGLRCSLWFHDVVHLWFNSQVFLSILKGCIQKKQFDSYNRRCDVASGDGYSPVSS